MQVAELNQCLVPLAAALVGAGAKDAFDLPMKAREAFDADLIAEPKPLSESDILARRLGVA